MRRKKHWFFRLFLLFIVVIGVLIWDSNTRLVVSTYNLSYDNLPLAFDGYKIVALSDLHGEEFGENNEKLIKKVQGENPDIIALTGDFIEKAKDGKGQVQAMEGFLTNLTTIAPCYFISGNHEWDSAEFPEFRELLERLSIKQLDNQFVILEKNGASLVLAGVSDPNGPIDMIKPPELVDIINANYPYAFTILLGHREDWLERYPNLDVDIIFCGHAHGGVIRLPFIGGVFGTKHQLFPEYDGGVYNEGTYDMVLSRGFSGASFVPRFLNNPEIVSVTLKYGK